MHNSGPRNAEENATITNQSICRFKYTKAWSPQCSSLHHVSSSEWNEGRNLTFSWIVHVSDRRLEIGDGLLCDENISKMSSSSPVMFQACSFEAIWKWMHVYIKCIKMDIIEA